MDLCYTDLCVPLDGGCLGLAQGGQVLHVVIHVLGKYMYVHSTQCKIDTGDLSHRTVPSLKYKIYTFSNIYTTGTP